MWSILLTQALALSNPGFVPGLVCEPLEGTIALTPDPTCAIASSPWRSWAFPQVTYLGELGVPGVCFSAETNMTWGGDDYVGQSDLGQTFNTFPMLEEPLIVATAGHVMEMHGEWGSHTGHVFLRHVGIVDVAAGTVEEELSVQGGTGDFLGARGTITLSGNPLEGAQMSGTLCRLPWP